MQSALRERQHKKNSAEEDEVSSPAPEERLSLSYVPGQSILTDTEEGTLQPSPPPQCPSAESLDKLQTKQTWAKKYRVSFLPHQFKGGQSNLCHEGMKEISFLRAHCALTVSPLIYLTA